MRRVTHEGILGSERRKPLGGKNGEEGLPALDYGQDCRCPEEILYHFFHLEVSPAKISDPEF